MNISGLKLRGEKGTWLPQYTEAAISEASSHPNLINGIPGRGNPLSGICNNYLSLSENQRKNVLVKVMPSLAYGEGHFGSRGKGGERSSLRLSQGPFQISKGAKDHGCWVGGYNPFDFRASIDCAYKIMDNLYSRRGLPIANNVTYWSVLRPGRFLSSRFMATFKNIAPECSSSYRHRPDKNFPGATIVGR